ncbi:aldo/keto reductase [Ramlibacter henchirensis]|uniref:Aldo/keto reductase n=1 Tax=Ramlibacter henchirensis TaxID=204072 RepID=A0A4Z0BXN7_9BURK|nr:aldo/keto reductase [Ramlibacter henchirensis]TFZ03080.1 aldo/keto reductase [Ramlibacter henchirensis]
MQHVQFGRTGLKVSRLCLGTMTFGLQCDEETSRAIMDHAFEAGIDFFDTADVYPLGGGLELAGRTEEVIGRWLQGRRHSVVIATKAAARVGSRAWDEGNSRKHLLDAIDASLKRLGTDYVDLYQLHRDDENTPLDESLEALDVIVRSGRARYVGVSNFVAWRLAKMLGRADLLRVARPVSVQPRYSLLFRQFERDLFPLAQEEGLAVIPYNPLAGGMLSGKYKVGMQPQEGTRFTLGKAGRMYQERYWHERELAASTTFASIAQQHGIVPAQAAIAWVLANPAVTSVIIGASKASQLTDSVAAVDVALTPELASRLEDMTREFRYGDAVR